MKLKELLHGLDVLELHADEALDITGVQYDSRQVTPGALFVAISGFQTDGHKYIPKAMENGAACVVCEKKPEAGIAYVLVSDARAALAALDSTARRLPNPRIFRRPALQAEAQSTSALEGTYAPLSEVLTADEERPPNADLREVLNYVRMADSAYDWIEDGRPLSVGMLEDTQAMLVRGTRSESSASGALRTHQVVIGRQKDAPP